jgi:hypothetical protein
MRTIAFILAFCLATAAAFAPAATLAGPACGRAARVPAARLPQPAAAEEVTTDLTAPFSDVELAEQESKLTALSEKWKRREEMASYQESIRSGWGPSPERINGRSAMFFIIVGLVTEYYTGQSLPQQVYTMLQTMGLVE